MASKRSRGTLPRGARRVLGDVLAMPVLSKEEPLLEYGLGVGRWHSKTTRLQQLARLSLPIPYLVYNGKF